MTELLFLLTPSLWCWNHRLCRRVHLSSVFWWELSIAGFSFTTDFYTQQGTFAQAKVRVHHLIYYTPHSWLLSQQPLLSLWVCLKSHRVPHYLLLGHTQAHQDRQLSFLEIYFFIRVCRLALGERECGESETAVALLTRVISSQHACPRPQKVLLGFCWKLHQLHHSENPRLHQWGLDSWAAHPTFPWLFL